MVQEEVKMEDLVLKAAKQNLDRDVRRGLMYAVGKCPKVTCWEDCPEDERRLYLEEARYLIKETGENYLPEFPDHEHIKVGNGR